MTLSLNALLAMAWRSVTNAREGAEELLALGIPRAALWPALLLVVVLSILLAQVTVLLVGLGDMGAMAMSPTATGVVQFVVLLIMVFAIFYVGRAMGGKGTFEEGLLLVAWLQFIMVCLQVVQTVTMLILPPIASLIGLFGIGLFFWLLTNFIAVLHGFRSLGQVFVMILISAFGIAFALSIVLTLFGVTAPMMTGQP